jgi:hypothetical protein
MIWTERPYETKLERLNIRKEGVLKVLSDSKVELKTY